MMTDPIADMLTRIRNAIMARLPSTAMPLSKQKLRIAQILKAEGYISDIQVEDGIQGTLTLGIKYGSGHAGAIAGLRRSSRPGRRLYVGHTDLPTVRAGLGTAIISTSQGVMTDKDARRRGIGGEVLCEVW